MSVVINVTDELRVPQAGSDPDDGSGCVVLGVQLAQVQELFMAWLSFCVQNIFIFNELFILLHTVYSSFSGILSWKACLRL